MRAFLRFDDSHSVMNKQRNGSNRENVSSGNVTPEEDNGDDAATSRHEDYMYRRGVRTWSPLDFSIKGPHITSPRPAEPIAALD